ncbi:MAG: lysine--tRNA ligase [Raoultibacter sp.]
MSEETKPTETCKGATAPEVIEDDPIEVRRAKREALIAAGEAPYGAAYHYTHHIADLEEKYAALENGEVTEDEVSLAGRVMARRDQGKILFMELRDSTADIQLFCRINVLGEEVFAHMKEVDVGDWIGVCGLMMRTRRGQLSVAADSYTLLSKSLRPLPEKFHGLADKETRYRQRYIDLVVNPEVRKTFESRFKVISAIRRYMEDLDFFEVETPMLHPIVGGANAKPFITHHNALDRELYLRIAPELHLKRLLVGGFEKVFELNRCFRNEGMDLTHNPEFTTLEVYQAYSDVEGMMDLTEGIVRHAALAACSSLQVEFQGQPIDLSLPFRRASMTQLASEGAGREISFALSLEELREIAQSYHLKIEKSWGKGKLICEIYEEVAEGSIIAPTFVIDHPVEVSPLAKRKPDDENVTDRFELLICGHEYANAFTELNDPVDQAARFQAQVDAKSSGDDEAMGFDADYIRALEYGMPPAGGLGIGIDRLVMLLTDSASIRDVLLFPHMRDEA